MSGSFQVLMVIERLLETSEPSPVDAVNGLAGRKQTKDWRVVGSLFTQGMFVVGFWNHRTSDPQGFGDFGVSAASDDMSMDVA